MVRGEFIPTNAFMWSEQVWGVLEQYDRAS